MKFKNIVLFGGSNSLKSNGLQKGLKEGITKYNVEHTLCPHASAGGGGLCFHNFALGASRSIQNLYELKKEQNRDILENAALIITESNINDSHHWAKEEGIPIGILYRNLLMYYEELFLLNKKVLVLILPFFLGEYYPFINNIHKQLCQKFGFNCIDLAEYYRTHDLIEFNALNWTHPPGLILRELGQNIIKNLDAFREPKSLKFDIQKRKFKVIRPNDLDVVSGTLKYNDLKNSAFMERAYRIDKSVILRFKSDCVGFHIIGLNTWNNFDGKTLKSDQEEVYTNFSTLTLSNNVTSLSKDVNFLNFFTEVGYFCDFEIDNNTTCFCRADYSPKYQERHYLVRSFQNNYTRFNFVDLIAFFAVDIMPEIPQFSFEDKVIISQDYDFSHFIPNVENYKELVDECAKTRLSVLEQNLQLATSQIQQLQNAYNTLLNEANQKLSYAQRLIEEQNAQIQEYQNLLKDLGR